MSLLFDCCLVSAFDPSISAPLSPGRTTITTHLTIQFDGCLRPPRDPGFPTISHRIGVCAACIGEVRYAYKNTTNVGNHNNTSKDIEPQSEFDSDFETTVTPLAVGAMEIPVAVETTSQHAEYEGLLMGLEWLVDVFSCQNGNQKKIVDSDFTGDSNRFAFPSQKHGQKERVLITIEGDCKTVIDQLTGKSIPRKLQSLHDRAERFLKELRAMQIIAATSAVDSNEDVDVIIEFRHIPRSQNYITDSLCNNLMNILSAKSWAENIHQLAHAENQIMQQKLLSSQVPTESPPLSNILETVTRRTKYSLRPHLYKLVASLAFATKDYKVLVMIGEKIISEGSSLNANANFLSQAKVGDQGHYKVIAEQTATSLKRRGVQYQILGWEGLGKEKKKRFLKRKYRRLLHMDDGSERDTFHDDLFLELNDGTTSYSRKTQPSESMKSRPAIGKDFMEIGDISEGEWDSHIPDLWKPILDKWFLSARYEDTEEVGKGKFSPLWMRDG